MKNQVLSIEQMKHLKELGVDTSKASCYWWYAEGKNYLYWGKCSDANGIPTFTLQDMLEMMPHYINDTYLDFCKDDIKTYIVQYKTNDGTLIFYHFGDLLNCAYECLCWLAKYGFLKGGKK